jgi:hypothetical protein
MLQNENPSWVFGCSLRGQGVKTKKPCCNERNEGSLNPTLSPFSLAVASEKSALSPKTWPFSVSLLPQQAYLVGGSVRDALLHRQADYLDRAL